MSRDRALQMRNIAVFQKNSADAAAMARALRDGIIAGEDTLLINFVQSSWARQSAVNSSIARKWLFYLIDQMARERRYKP